MRKQMDQELNYWPSVADCMLALFMIVLILAITSKLLDLIPESEIADPEKTIIRLKKENDKYKKDLETLGKELEMLKTNPNIKPPIIELTEAQNLNFEKGKAHVSDSVRRELQKTHFPDLLKIVKEHPTVDTIEIIGHTDDTPVSTRSNLDGSLVGSLQRHFNVKADQLSAGSNADLGLMRAVAVKQEWDQWLIEKNINLPRKIEVRCYSASNGVPPREPDNLSQEERDTHARRIEIRFTQIQK
ncbi:MAG: hypothetical protein U1F76_18980 [Candidatus Competibacteraceae bacterium]